MSAQELEALGRKAYNSSHWPGKGFSKRDKKLIGFLLFSLGLQAVAINCLPLTESSPCELNHLFVSMRDQANPVDHFGKKACGIAAPRESKHIDVVPGGIILHEEFVSPNDVVGEGRADSTVFHLRIPVL